MAAIGTLGGQNYPKVGTGGQGQLLGFAQLSWAWRSAEDDRTLVTNPKGHDHCVPFCKVYIFTLCVNFFLKTLNDPQSCLPPSQEFQPLPRSMSSTPTPAAMGVKAQR